MKGLALIALLVIVWIWFISDPGEKMPDKEMKTPKLPTTTELAETTGGSPECSAVIKETVEKKMAMQEELQEALAAEDLEALNRLDREIGELERKMLAACE